jgi:hypothetical protein
MRSSTVFLVVGILIFLVIVYTAFASHARAQHPVMRRTNDFLQAIKAQNVAAITGAIDPQSGHIQTAGAAMSALKFDALTSFEGKAIAFGSRPAVNWTYLQLQPLEVDQTIEPTINADAGLATVTLTSGAMLYFHLKNGEWLIYYLAEPKSPK